MNKSNKARTIFVMSSNYPRFSGDVCGWFIHEISRLVVRKDYRVISLSPHTQNSKVREVMDDVDVNRFLYFFPVRFERLAYGSGILFNMRKSPVAFFNIVPFFLSEFFCAVKIVLRNQVTLIHTHWLLPQGFIGSLFHWLVGIPHIATIHGSDLNLINNHRFLKYLCRFIVRNSDTITVNSSYIRRQLLSIVAESAPKIQVIPMGVDPEKYRAVGITDLKKRFGTPNLLLSVGRLIDIKGIIYLIEAMPAVLRKYPDTKLLIIGNGPEKDHLSARVRDLSLGDFVIFCGMIKQDELPSYYHAADIFILPSIERSGSTEALGVVLLEAMASGCPVIGSSVGGIPDIITDGENGFLVPEQDPVVLAEKIVLVLSDPILQEKFRKNGYDRIQQSFSWEKISNDFSDVYTRVIPP